MVDAYLQGGGCVVFFLGDQVLADRYNRELGVAGEGRAGGPRICPPAWETSSTSRSFASTRSAIGIRSWRRFGGRGETSLYDHRFKHYQLTPSQELAQQRPSSRSATAIRRGRELVRHGRVVLVGTSASRRGPPCRFGRVSFRWFKKSWRGVRPGRFSSETSWRARRSTC